jgi:hypothetical protein
VNSQFDLQVLVRWLNWISRVRMQFRAKGSCFLLRNNGPAHSDTTRKWFLANSGTLEVSRPLCLPDVAPVGYFLFDRVKTALIVWRYEDLEGPKTHVTDELNVIALNAFGDCLVQLLERCKTCVAVKGNYFWDRNRIFVSCFICVCSSRLCPGTSLFDKMRKCDCKIL